eukprot:8665316-Lingulodinium_polyedra.AAC.1
MHLYLFEVVDLQGGEEPQRYMSIQPIDGTKATIPKTIVCLQGDGFIDQPFDWKMAMLTNPNKDFKKQVWEMFPGAMWKERQLKYITRRPEFATKVEHDLQSPKNGGSSTSGITAAPVMTPPAKATSTPTPRRTLAKSLSEVSIRGELKSSTL